MAAREKAPLIQNNHTSRFQTANRYHWIASPLALGRLIRMSLGGGIATGDYAARGASETFSDWQ